MARDDRPLDGVPVVPWSAFAERLQWRQGEHVSLIGPTGQGKTTLALALLPRRRHSVVVATKPRDRTLAGLKREGYERISAWPPPRATSNRVLLWPGWKDPTDSPKQAAVIRDALHSIFNSGAWSILVDDVQYLTDHLRLGDILRPLWLQSRALDITLIGSTQRPRWAPLEMFSQATHLFLWQTADDDDLRRLGGLGGLNSKRIRSIVAELPRHHALYVNTRTSKLAITKAERSKV